MARARRAGRPGGYLGIALLASMVTLGVMFALFTEGQASPMEIDVGDPLSQDCDSTVDGADACYAVVVKNVSDGEVSGSVTCSVTNPKDAFATFVNGKHEYDSEPILPGGTATVIIQVDRVNGARETDPPGIDCAPA
jgi:hypothetical protein